MESEEMLMMGMWLRAVCTTKPAFRMEALARRDAGEALTEIGRSYAVSHSTISRLR
jgi:hypothetical protein